MLCLLILVPIRYLVSVLGIVNAPLSLVSLPSTSSTTTINLSLLVFFSFGRPAFKLRVSLLATLVAAHTFLGHQRHLLATLLVSTVHGSPQLIHCITQVTQGQTDSLHPLFTCQYSTVFPWSFLQHCCNQLFISDLD